MYDNLRRRGDLARKYGAVGVPTYERLMLPLAYPIVYKWIDHHLGITPTTATNSLDEVRAIFDGVGDLPAGGTSAGRASPPPT